MPRRYLRMEKEISEVRIGGVYDKPGKRHQAGSVYDINAIAPTITAHSGGHTEPLILICRK